MGEHSADRKPEVKVVAATGGSVIGSGAAIAAVVADLPQWAQVLVIVFGPPVAAFVSGYLARHTAIPEQG